MEEKIKAILLEAGKTAKIVEINQNLETLQKIVGGYIELLYPFEDEVAICCNEEGKILGLPLNRPLKDEDGEVYDIIAGDSLVLYAPSTSEEFESMPENLLKKYYNKFFYPIIV